MGWDSTCFLLGAKDSTLPTVSLFRLSPARCMPHIHPSLPDVDVCVLVPRRQNVGDSPSDVFNYEGMTFHFIFYFR